MRSKRWRRAFRRKRSAPLVTACLTGVLPKNWSRLCYAQHWAETDANPEPEARARLLETYGDETVAQIDLALRMIRIGNLTGNLLDYILFRLSFGRIDIDKPPKMSKVGSAEKISINSGGSLPQSYIAAIFIIYPGPTGGAGRA
jgi:hypothetical protein